MKVVIVVVIKKEKTSKKKAYAMATAMVNITLGEMGLISDM